MILDVNRVEKKYLIDPVEMQFLKSRISTYMQEDAHNGSSGYIVRSVYFDSLYDSDFFDKEDGVDDRKKIRLRIYNTNSDVAKLELKEKKGGVQRKRSLLIKREEAEALIQGDFHYLKEKKEPLAQNIYLIMQMGLYRPKCMVEYDRFAYLITENDTRITFDTNLRGSESNFNLFTEDAIMYPLISPTEITLEVKYNGFLMSNIKKALSYKMYTQISNSKYVKSRMLLRQRGGK
ncbi:MAG: polyphosphate polymerase domain-containing protein [Lachnospiraceae bacterium]|nr:polyphosphate polymerase domain-containing protein [Lachnospiraceae bacterium]